MQNPHNFFGIQPGSSHAGNLDPGTASRQTYMPFAPNAGVGDNPYAVNGSVVERSYPSNLAAGESSHVPVMNIMSGMLGPPRLPGVDHASMHNSWNSASLGNPRDSSSEMFRQFQIHRAQEGTPPVLPPPGQFSAGASGSAGAMPFGEVTPPSSSGVDVSMMLAQAMSVPLATAFLQSLLANAPASVPAPQTNAGIFPVAPSAPNPMVQMMMQMFQSSQQPASAVQIASPNLGTVQSPVPGSSGSASNLHAVQSPVAGASVLASVPSQAASSNGSPQAIQLPPLDANVAKTLLLQLAQQLQQAGQLPNDDTFQNFLRTIQSPGSTMTTSTDSASVVKTEIKKEPSDNLASRRKAPETTSKQLVKHVAKSEPAEEIMLKKESSKESDDIKLSKSSLSRVSSSGVYIDVAEGAVFTNMSEDTSSEDDAGNDTDGGRSCDEATDNELLSHVQLKSRNRSKSGNSSSVTHKSGGRSVSPIVGKKVAKGKGLSERDKGRPTEMYRSKSQTSHHSESSQDDNSGSRTTVQGYARKSVTPEVRHHKARSKDGLRGVQWNPNIRLKDCSIRLVRVRIVRDSNGRILIPKKESSRVTRLKQHKVHINVLSSYEDPDEPVIPKLERADSIDTGSSYYQSAPLEQKVRTNAEVPRPSVSRPVSTDASYRFTNEKLSSGQQPLQVAVSSNINSSKSPQLRSMYMGLIKDNMEWLSLVGCYRKPSGSSQQQQPKQYCQCAFCPAVGDVPLDVALHIRAEHSELTFALNKIRASTGSVLYICCRHCDFVAVEPTILWIHFEIHHNIPGILDSSGGRHPNINLSIDDPPLRRFSLDDTLASATSFVCFDCGAVVAEKDTTASSSRLARHVLRRHPDTQNYNGCFVKLLMLQHIETDAGLPRSAITYRDAIYEQAYERGRREVFVCMLCRYSAFCPYLALSHNLMTHQTKYLLYICSDCNYQCMTDSDMLSHNNSHHRGGAIGCAFTCSATLVKQSEYGTGYVEYPSFSNRKSVLVLVKKQMPTDFNSSRKLAEKRARSKTDVCEDEASRRVKQFKESKDRPEPERRSSRLTASKSDDKQYYVDDGDDSDVEVQNMTVSSTEDRTSSASAAAVSDGTASARNRSQKSEAAASNVRCMDVAERKVAVGGGLVAVTSIAEERAADDGVVTVRSEVSSERRRGTDQAATPADSTVLNGGGQVTAARRAQGLSGADGETSVKPTSLLPLNGGTCKVVLNKIKHEWVDLSKFPVDRRVTVGKNASVEKSSAQFVPGEENDGTSAAREAPEADASRNKSETAEATDVVEDNASSDVAGEKPVADTNTTKSETAEATDVVEDNASSDVAGKKPDADTNTTKSETAEATDVVEDNASSDVAGKKPDADTNTTKSETVVATDVVEDNASSDVARETSDTIEMTLSDENAASRINETLSEARNGAADGIRIPADGDRRTGEETGERSGSLSPTAGLLAISDDVNHENNTLVAPCPVAEAGMSSLIGNDGVGDDARRVEPLTGVNHENNTPVAPCPVAEAGMSSLIGNDGVSDDARRVEPLTGDAAVTVKQEVPVDVACENAVENEDLSVSSNRLSAVRDATGSAGRWVFEAIKSMVDDMATTDHRTSGDDCAAGLKGLASFEPLTNNASGVDCSEDGPLSLMLSDDEPISTGLSTQSGSSDVVGCPDMGTD